MQRYFIDKNAIKDNIVSITGNDFYHISKVMRMKVNNQVIVCDNEYSWLCTIDSFTADSVYLKILEKLDEKKELPIEITIAQGIVCREKMEEVIDKITQLGASHYLPVQMKRCTAKLNDEKLERKMARMNKIAKEASEQSHRTKLLKVDIPVTFNEMIKLSTNYDLCLYAYELVDLTISIKKVLQENNPKSILILVGPEGGISSEEATILNENGFLPVGLGPRILRTEVAPTYIMAAISYELEG